jgi:hypothetical protein
MKWASPHPVTGDDVVLEGESLLLAFEAMSWRLIEIRDKHRRYDLLKAGLHPYWAGAACSSFMVLTPDRPIVE